MIFSHEQYDNISRTVSLIKPCERNGIRQHADIFMPDRLMPTAYLFCAKILPFLITGRADK